MLNQMEYDMQVTIYNHLQAILESLEVILRVYEPCFCFSFPLAAFNYYVILVVPFITQLFPLNSEAGNNMMKLEGNSST